MNISYTVIQVRNSNKTELTLLEAPILCAALTCAGTMVPEAVPTAGVATPRGGVGVTTAA